LYRGFPCNCDWNAELKKPSPVPLTEKQPALQADMLDLSSGRAKILMQHLSNKYDTFAHNWNVRIPKNFIHAAMSRMFLEG